MSPITNIFHWVKSAGRPEKARLSQWSSLAQKIVRESDALSSLSDEELLKRALDLRWRAKTGSPLRKLLVEAYALVRDASRRTLNMQHYPVQLIGGIAMFEGHIAEMQTGEGKTLTAVLPAFLRALPGHGCHIVTVNDYLACRDAEWMGPIYRMVGLTVGGIKAELEDNERRDAYSCDITYATAKELGFDFLRDRLRKGVSSGEETRRRRAVAGGGEPPVIRRGHYFALVDEADSVLIDDARTPLIIGLTQPNSASTISLLRWSHRVAGRLESPADYIYEPDRRSAYLTEKGCRKVLLMGKPRLLDSIGAEDFYTHVERAVTARNAFHRDRDYIVKDDEVMIVDESTGRVMEGRKWQDGLHQAIEAKELLPLTADNAQAARITMQRFFQQYAHTAGMTGTAVTAARELKSNYGLSVTAIPTHRHCVRIGLPPRIFASGEAKRAAIVEEIERIHRDGRAVLVGTPSVDSSEILRKQLKERGIPHQILNARFHEEEARIISEAGRPAHVTIATNMAGRGTDIELDEKVREKGGLHVIATELHSSARIDRQLIGRAARQGDPGSYQFFLSLDDELLRCRPRDEVEELRKRARADTNGELPAHWLSVFRRTQRFLERLFRRQRKQLLRSEKAQMESLRRMGLDPYLELSDGI